MLGDVGNTGVGVLPNISSLGLNLSNKKLDHGGLSGAVLSNAGNAGAQRNLNGDIEQGRLLVYGIGEGALRHLHEGLSLRFDTLDGSRLGELELHLGFGEGEVGTSAGLDLNKLIQVTLVEVQLQVLNLQDVGAAIIEETRVVGHHDDSDIGEGVDVLLHPSNIDNIQVVGGLVHEQDIGLLKHGTGKGELHSPSSGEGGHGVIGLGLSIRDESDGGKHLPNLFTGASQSLDLLVNEDVIDTAQVTLLSLNISLNENGAHIRTIGEALNGVVGNGPHEGGLSGIVSSQKTVLLTPQQLHLSVVKKNLGTVGQGELTVTQLLRIILIIVLLGNLHHLLSLNTDLLNGLLRLGSIKVCGEGGESVLLPLHILHELQVHHASRDGSSMFDTHFQSARGIITAEGLLEFRHNFGGVSTDADGLVSQVLKTVELLDSLFGDATGLGVSNGRGIGLKSREEEGKEGCGIERIVNKLGHVVDNNSRLTLGGGGLLPQSTKEEGHNHGESGRFDGLDEGDSGHLVHDLRHLLGLGDGGQNLLRHVLNILVSNDLKRLSHGLGGGLLDLLLGVPHASGDLGHDLGEGVTELLGCDGSEGTDALERQLTDGPLLLHGKLGEDHRKEGLHGEGVDGCADGEGGVGGGLDNGLGLVSGLLDAGGQALLGDRLGIGSTLRKSLDEGEGGEGIGLGFGLRLGGKGVNVRRQSRLFNTVLFDLLHEGGLVSERQLLQL
mmetsp:Transcript_6537/g.10320  ORF Transcript_6537/g.10320 Transcript_6537/m.10320 type:complete len:723 (-) Transcript_6537:88-2256(-)